MMCSPILASSTEPSLPDEIAALVAAAEDLRQRVERLCSSEPDLCRVNAGAAGCEVLDAVLSTIDAARPQVRSVRDRLWAHSCSLRNEHARINTLPPEILSAIFRELSAPLSFPVTNAWDEIDDWSFHWVIITEVCQHWRQVAFDDPRLWTVIDVDVEIEESVEHSVAWMRRAGTLPLDVRIRNLDPSAFDLMRPLISKCAQFQKLYIDNFYSDPSSSLKYFSFRAPKLQVLSITMDDASHEFPKMFDGDLTSVRYLTLSSFTSFSNNTINNLVYLRLTGQMYSEQLENMLDIENVIPLIQRNPLLEEILLEGFAVISRRRRTPSPPQPLKEHVNLSRLKHLLLARCSPLFLSPIINRLSLGHSDVAFAFYASRYDCPSLTGVLPAKAESRLSPLLEATTYQLAFTEKCVDIHAVSATSVAHLHLEDMCMVEELHRFCSFGSLQELWVKLVGVFKHRFLAREVLTTLPSLRTLVLHRESQGEEGLDRWLKALVGAKHEYADLYPAPSLHSLHMIGHLPNDTIKDLLTLTLDTRRKDGHPIQSLRVSYDSKFEESFSSADLGFSFHGFMDFCKSQQCSFVETISYEVVPSDSLLTLHMPESCKQRIEYDADRLL